MASYLIGALVVGGLCGAWALVQTWITSHEPDIRGPESGCGNCGGGGGCGGGKRTSDDSGSCKNTARQRG